MSSGLVRPPQSPQLHWLPAIPFWDERLRKLELADAQAWPELVALANSGLDSLETLVLDRKLTQLFGKLPPPNLSTRPIHLALLSSSTVSHLSPAIRVGALRRGIWVDIYVPPYGQYSQALRDTNSELHDYKPDCVLFALDASHLLASIEVSATVDQVNSELDRVFTDLTRNWQIARTTFDCHIIQQTPLPVLPLLVGSNEHRLPGASAWVLSEFNRKLRTVADVEQIDLLAIDTRFPQEGLSAWHDPGLWLRAKQEVHPGAAPVYGDLVGRLLAAGQGRSSKCLVLDLDNTLWGGVVGDDGLSGIVLGQGSARGEAFVAFQKYVRDLSRRGVILAVCTKNDEANAWEPFDKHPEMVLKRSDIACLIANWSDKPSNLRNIAERLNIGIDALVFADDNPFEREIVRRELPSVLVPELPEDPAFYPICLADAGYFEAVSITKEDLKRAGQYQSNRERENLKTSTTDLEGYLRSLNMELRWAPFDRIGLQRIVQLINKTNQFNLTTRRYTEAEVLALMNNPVVLSLQLRLLDRFGDNGMIGVIVAAFEPATTIMTIDTWLMSCRVLGRQVEAATLNVLASEASRMGAMRLIGHYRPTDKNAMVRDHYPQLGFEPVNQSSDDSMQWMLDLAGFSPIDVHMTVTRTDKLAAA